MLTNSLTFLPSKRWNLGPLPLNLGGARPLWQPQWIESSRGDAAWLPRLLPVSRGHTLSPCERSCCSMQVAARRYHVGRLGRPALAPQTPSEESLEMNAFTLPHSANSRETQSESYLAEPVNLQTLSKTSDCSWFSCCFVVAHYVVLDNQKITVIISNKDWNCGGITAPLLATQSMLG